MKKRSFQFLSACLLCLSMSILIYAQESSKTTVKADPKAEELIRNAAKFFQQQQSMSVKVNNRTKVTLSGQTEEHNTIHNLYLKRPNQYAIIAEDQTDPSFYSDNKRIVSYIPRMKNSFVVDEAPKDSAGLYQYLEELDFAGAVVAVANFANMNALLFLEDPYNTFIGNASDISLLPEKEVEGISCTGIQITSEPVSYSVWIQTGDQPFIRQIVPNADDLKNLYSRRQSSLPSDFAIESSVTFSDWQLNPALSDEQFAFTPPAESKEVDSFMEVLAGHSHPLVSKPAPVFAADLLEGGKFSLAEQKGKNVVILDFWATWCPPCREGMPILNKIGNEYKDKGVVFVAVNQQEEGKKIKEFLQNQKLNMTVAFDPESEIAEQYQVTNIPQTVIIDKNGTITDIHVGVMSEQLLRKKLNRLLKAN